MTRQESNYKYDHSVKGKAVRHRYNSTTKARALNTLRVQKCNNRPAGKIKRREYGRKYYEKRFYKRHRHYIGTAVLINGVKMTVVRYDRRHARHFTIRIKGKIYNVTLKVLKRMLKHKTITLTRKTRHEYQ